MNARNWLDSTLESRLLQYPGNAPNLERLLNMFGRTGQERPVAFVGAGLSAPLLPDWPSLLRQLGVRALTEGMATDLEIDQILQKVEDDPLNVAGRLRAKLGASLLLETLTEIYGRANGKWTSHQEQLLCLPFKGYATTNYDNCIEYARRAKFPYAPLPPPLTTHANEELLRKWLDRSAFDDVAPIVHLHGSIEYPSTLVLDDETYRALYDKPKLGELDKPFHRLSELLWLQERLVIVGFSGRDPLIRAIAKKTLNTFKWPAAGISHIAIVPLELSKVGEVPDIRREFEEFFHAGVVFFDPDLTSADGAKFADLDRILQAIAVVHPSQSEIERLARRKLTLDNFKEAVTDRLRGWLRKIAPRTGTAMPGAPIYETFWVPTIKPMPPPNGSAVTSAQKLDSKPLPPVEDILPMLTVLYGEAGTGKTVLSRLLALGLAEGTGLGNVTDVLQRQTSGRDLPVLVDLRKSSDGLLANREDRIAAVKASLVSVWGERAARALADNLPADRTIIIIDGLEALLWSTLAQASSSLENRQTAAWEAANAVLVAIRESFPGVPVIVMARAFTQRWWKAIGEAPLGFEIESLRPPDVEQVASVHLFGKRKPPPEHHLDPRLNDLLRNAALKRFASAPLFVKRALDIIGNSGTVEDFAKQRIISTYFDHIVGRGAVDDDDARPVEVPQARQFLRAIAYKLIESGGTVLSLDDVADCGEHIGLPRDTAIDAMQWLGDHTELIVAEPDGGISFAHDWDREYFAAEMLEERYEPSVLAVMAKEDRWRQPVLIATGISRPQMAAAIIIELLQAGLEKEATTAAADAAEILRSLDDPTREQLIDRLCASSRGTFEWRLPLVNVLSALSGEANRRLLLRTALPLSPLTTAEALDRYSELDWARTSMDELIQTLNRRVKHADHLVALGAPSELKSIVFTYGHNKKIGGGWQCSSIVASYDCASGVAPRFYSTTEWLSSLMNRLSDDVALALVEAAFSLGNLSAQMKLLVMALWLEREFGRSNWESPGAEKTVNMILRGLKGIPTAESPAFVTGMVNAVLNRIPSACAPTRRDELMAIRRAALLAHGKLFGAFLSNTWSERDEE